MLVDDLHHDSGAVLKNCNKHLRIDPDDITALCRRGLTLMLNGEPHEEPQADFDEVFRLRPDIESVIRPLISGAMDRSRSSRLSEHGQGERRKAASPTHGCACRA